MKKSILLAIAILPALLGTSCNYSTRELNIYRKPGEVDKTIKVKYFKDSPNVPYISVSQFYNEFYKTSLRKFHNRTTNYEYMYLSNYNEIMSFNVKNQWLRTSGIRGFDDHPDYKSSTGKLFVKYDSATSTDRNEKIIKLSDYSIKIYERFREVYVPITLLSDLTGGLSGYDITYNGKDIYVIDYNGYLGDSVTLKDFGEEYSAPLNNVSEDRPIDLAKYTYNELCLVFDNFRGYTKQLVFGDDDLINLGLDKLLESKHPKIKEYLLSSNKLNYYEGLYALFNGLHDGGHTGILYDFDALGVAVNRKSEQDFLDLQEITTAQSKERTSIYTSFAVARRTKLNIPVAEKNYYYYNSDHKTAYIGFSGFSLDLNGWDNYYNGKGEVPVSTDTYAFVRSKMYQAKEDGAENIVLDLTYNGGGSSYSLEGILALFNKGKGYINTTDVVGGYTVKENHLIDINLDGAWDEKDVLEASKFNFNVGVLTSKYAFSCGNLFPYSMKELGYKILGQKSGGGSCAVAIDTTADGIMYAHSSYLCLTDNSGDNIDGGVEVDFDIPLTELTETLYSCDNYFDFESISNYLSAAYSH